MFTSEVAVVKSHHGISVKCSRYRDTGTTDPSLVIADPKVGEQYILTKYSKCNIFQVIADLLNSQYLRIAIAQLCHEL